MIQKIIPIAASITLIGSASLTAYADMVPEPSDKISSII